MMGRATRNQPLSCAAFSFLVNADEKADLIDGVIQVTPPDTTPARLTQ
jgi:hypothetical protein